MIIFTPLSLFFIFLLGFVLEVGLLFSLADEIGVLGVVLEILITFFLGSYLIRRKFWHYITSGGFRGKDRGDETINKMIHIQDALIYLFAGMLLMIPGLITDGLGLILILPFMRDISKSLFKKTGAMDYSKRKIFEEDLFRKTGEGDFHQSNKQSPIIETEYYEVGSDTEKDTERSQKIKSKKETKS